MTAQTRLSAKGQVVIPKDVRDRLGLIEGTVFDVVERAGEVVLKLPTMHPKLSVDEVQAQIRDIFVYRGPPVSDAQIAAVGPRIAAEKYRRFVKRNAKNSAP